MPARDLIRAALPEALGAIGVEGLTDLARRGTLVALRRGEAPFRRGEPADAWYLVLSGRLRRMVDGAGARQAMAGEIGRGESFGEEALLGSGARATSPVALRHTHVLRFTADATADLLAKHPGLWRVLLGAAARGRPGPPPRPPSPAPLLVAVVPIQTEIDVEPMAQDLSTALARLGPTLRVPQPPPEIGPPLDPSASLRLAAWLADRARNYRFVMLEAGAATPGWAELVLAHADRALLVADATRSPATSALETRLLDAAPPASHPPRTLVLLHPRGTTLPRGTARWLAGRAVEDHRHLGAGRPADVERLARAVAGVEVGLVLGAGGARGLAHIGVLAALAEAGVPVDQIGGTSVGALVAGAHAMGRSAEEILEIARRLRAARPFTDWALPVTSLLHGRRFEGAVRSIFGDVAIEDLWVPFFCTSCDIARFRDVLHGEGPLADAALASSALPAVLPPRAVGGGLLVDGGTTHMVPTPPMRARCRGPLIAVDVGADREIHYPAGRHPTSWSALWDRLRPGRPRPLTALEVFWRAAACDLAQRTAAVAEDVELFLQPPVERFGTVDLESMDEIVHLGREHARARLAGFAVAGREPAPGAAAVTARPA